MSATMVMTPSKSAMTSRRTPFPSSINTGADVEFQRAVSQFLSVKDRPFSVSGTIPVSTDDPLILFFRTASGISHSLPFPLKTDSLHQLPALNVLLAACETTHDSSFDESVPITENTERELPLAWPTGLPFSTTFELANHPVLDTVRSVLFPNCYPGTYLFVQRSSLEVVLAGARSEARRPSASRGLEGRLDGAKLVAKIIVTLPVRFRGGALTIRNPEGDEDRFFAPAQTSKSNGDTQLYWTAFLADCEHEVEYVEQGCRMSISYGVYMKTFGPVGPRPNPLITPNDQLLDALSPVLNLARGRRLGIYLTGRYDCHPADVLADSLVPSLKGSDAVLYHALRLYKLAPELRWAAAGYVWPVDKTVQLSAYNDRDEIRSMSRQSVNYPYSAPNSPLQSGRLSRQRRRSFSRAPSSYDGQSTTGSMVGIGMSGMPMSAGGAYSSRSVILDREEEDEEEDLRERVTEGGAIPLREADVMMLTARDQSISKERVPFVSRGTLDRLFVNILLVAYVQ